MRAAPDLPLFQWKPPCRVIIFPNSWRAGTINTQVEMMTRMKPSAIENNIGRFIKVQRNRMAGVGAFTEDEIERDLIDLERALRAALWRRGLRSVRSGEEGGDAA